MRIDEILTSRDIMQKGDVDAYDFDDMIGHSYDMEYRIDGYEIHFVDDNYDKVFLIKDPDSEGFLGELRLKPDGNFFKSTVKFAPELQGKGLAHKLYRLAIVDEGVTIVSDTTQSPGSRRIWERLADEDGIVVYGWKPATDDFFHWHPDEDPAEEVYMDADQMDKLQQAYGRILIKLRQSDPDSPEDAEYREDMKVLAQQMNALKAGAGQEEVRLVATSEAGLNECAGVGKVVPGVNTTVDVGPDEIMKQAKKFGNTVSKDGVPNKRLKAKNER